MKIFSSDFCSSIQSFCSIRSLIRPHFDFFIVIVFVVVYHFVRNLIPKKKNKINCIRKKNQFLLFNYRPLEGISNMNSRFFHSLALALSFCLNSWQLPKTQFKQKNNIAFSHMYMRKIPTISRVTAVTVGIVCIYTCSHCETPKTKRNKAKK